MRIIPPYERAVLHKVIDLVVARSSGRPLEDEEREDFAQRIYVALREPAAAPKRDSFWNRMARALSLEKTFGNLFKTDLGPAQTLAAKAFDRTNMRVVAPDFSPEGLQWAKDMLRAAEPKSAEIWFFVSHRYAAFLVNDEDFQDYFDPSALVAEHEQGLIGTLWGSPVYTDSADNPFLGNTSLQIGHWCRFKPV